jgi:hypothetical protein
MGGTEPGNDIRKIFRYVHGMAFGCMTVYEDHFVTGIAKSSHDIEKPQGLAPYGRGIEILYGRVYTADIHFFKSGIQSE